MRRSGLVPKPPRQLPELTNRALQQQRTRAAGRVAGGRVVGADTDGVRDRQNK